MYRRKRKKNIIKPIIIKSISNKTEQNNDISDTYIQYAINNDKINIEDTFEKKESNIKPLKMKKNNNIIDKELKMYNQKEKKLINSLKKKINEKNHVIRLLIERIKNIKINIDKNKKLILKKFSENDKNKDREIRNLKLKNLKILYQYKKIISSILQNNKKLNKVVTKKINDTELITKENKIINNNYKLLHNNMTKSNNDLKLVRHENDIITKKYKLLEKDLNLLKKKNNFINYMKSLENHCDYMKKLNEKQKQTNKKTCKELEKKSRDNHNLKTKIQQLIDENKTINKKYNSLLKKVKLIKSQSSSVIKCHKNIIDTQQQLIQQSK